MFPVQALKASLRQINSKYSTNLLGKLSSDASKNTGGYESVRKLDHIPSTYDKYVLVWTKKYPSLKDIPPAVPQATMDKARSVSRIRINVIMCIMTGFLCFLMVIAGKNSAKKGENVTQMNLDWHQMQNQDKK